MMVRPGLMIVLALVLHGFGCATPQTVDTMPAPAQPDSDIAKVSGGAPSGAIVPAAQPAQPAQAAHVLLVDSLERADIKSLKKVVIRLPHADVSLSGQTKGYLRIVRSIGAVCKVQVIEREDSIEILEPAPQAVAKVSGVAKAVSALPSVNGCRFTIALGLHQPAETDVELTRGSLLAEMWTAPIRVKMEWGDIDVGSVGPLTVKCGRCTLAGEGVDGPLRYSLEAGNVGLAGLTSSAEGRTLGDTVLKWSRVRPGSSVSLISNAGDVILYFPGTIPLAIDLKAPRGEVSSRFESGGQGIPVAVTAELGNVQVFRVGKDSASRR